MRSYPWPTEGGWPYPDGRREAVEVGDQVDDDLLSLQVGRATLLAALTPLEREVLTARFGLDGTPARSLRELRDQMGMPRNQVRDVLVSGLTKLRRTMGA